MGDVVPIRAVRAGTGMRLGKYDIVGSLAAGGMAELFVARQAGIEGFEKLVVLKRILPQLATREDFVRMFLGEARLAATLHHPNIAQVYDIGFEPADRSYFFTMEYVQGRDARDVLRTARDSGGLPLEHALAIVGGIAAGLHYAHERNIVHRDVSPSNVLISFDGNVKLVDFGIAKVRSQHSETQAGSLKGKIAYMSPEQCRGEDVDRRSDVFALGVLLYELTTGTRLYRGSNEFALIQDITGRDAPLPSTRRADYPRALEAIVMRALERNRDRRTATAEELQLELERFAHDARLNVSEVALRRYMRALFGETGTKIASAAIAEGSASAVDPPAAVLMDAEPPDEISDVDAELAAPPPPITIVPPPHRWLVPTIAGLGLSLTAFLVYLFTTTHHASSPPRAGSTSEAFALSAPTPPRLSQSPTPTPTPPPSPAPAPSLTPSPTLTPSPSPTPPPVAAKPPAKPRPPQARPQQAQPKNWDPDSPFLPGGK